MITPRNCLTSIESLREWFERQNVKYWTLFNGNSTRPSDAIHRNNMTEGEEESWELLETTITNLSGVSGGYFTVLAKNTDKSTNGTRVQVYLNPYATNQPNHMAGISGMGGGMGSVQGMIKDAVEKERLRTQIMMLEAQVEEAENGNMISRIGERIAEHPQLPALVTAILSKILGPQGGQIAMTGFDAVPAPQKKRRDMTNEDTATMDDDTMAQTEEQTDARQTGNQQMDFVYDSERLAVPLEQIRSVFPDVHSFMETLGNFVESKPDLAQQFFNAQSGGN